MNQGILTNQRKTCFLLSLIFLLSASFHARSATESWNPGGAGGGDGTWDTGITANWNSGQTWTTGSDALFSGVGGTVTLVTPSANSLTFTASGSYLLQSGTLTLTGSNITVNSDATIASDILSTDGLSVAGPGALTLSGTAALGSGNLTVGTSATGTLQIDSGGAVSDATGYIGASAGSNGAVSVFGGGSTWSNQGDLYVGYSGTGTLQISDGGVVSNGESNHGGIIGYGVGSSGQLTVSGSGSEWTNSEDISVGYSGTGALLITSGGAVSNRNTYIANNAGSTGTMTVTGTGSTASNTDDFYVGNSGAGTLLISGGGSVSVSGAAGYIGYNTDSRGMATVTGTGSTWSNDNLHVGESGTGTLVISNGGAVSDNAGIVGNFANSSGAVTVTGIGSSWSNSSGNLVVGYSGAGTLLIYNGAAVSDGDGYIGESPGSNGAVTVSGAGSAWSTPSGLYIGGNSFGVGGTGLLDIAAGGSVNAGQTTLYNTSTLAFGENTTFDSSLTTTGGTVTLVDGQLQTITFADPVSITGSALDFDVGAGSDQIAFSGAGSLSVTGTGAVNLYGLSGQVTSGTDVLIAAPTSGELSLKSVYNTGNFTYALLSTSTSEDVVVTAAGTPLTLAYWKGGHGNLWSILLGGTATNWTTDPAGTIDPQLTPSATTDVVFSATSAANESNTVLGTDMTINSLTISDTNAVVISGSNPNSWLATNTLTIAQTTGTSGITVNSGAGKVTIGANVALGASQTWTNNSAHPLTVNGQVSGAFSLTTAGSGILDLTGNNTYTGATTVNNSAVIVTGSLSGTASASVSNGSTLEVDGLLNSSATTTVSGLLSGVGSVGPITLQTGGVLAPGLESGVTAAGTLTANGNVSLAADSTFSIRLGVVTVGDNDQLAIGNGGIVSLNGATLQLTLGSVLNTPASLGRKYVIINGGAGATGTVGDTFAETSPFTTPGGYQFDIFYASDANGDGTGTGDDVVLELTAIPEPATWAMLLCGLGTLGLANARKQKRMAAVD
jgi:T5SS/PEP-CTERM-associated repeat protein